MFKKDVKKYQKDHLFGSEIGRQNDRNFEATFMRRKDHLFISFSGALLVPKDHLFHIFFCRRSRAYRTGRRRSLSKAYVMQACLCELGSRDWGRHVNWLEATLLGPSAPQPRSRGQLLVRIFFVFRKHLL